MADKPGQYWDYEECAWVRWAAAESTVEIPSQAAAPQRMGIEAEREADVRSG